MVSRRLRTDAPAALDAPLPEGDEEGSRGGRDVFWVGETRRVRPSVQAAAREEQPGGVRDGERTGAGRIVAWHEAQAAFAVPGRYLVGFVCETGGHGEPFSPGAVLSSNPLTITVRSDHQRESS